MENNLLELLHAIYSEIKQTNLRLDKIESGNNQIKNKLENTQEKINDIEEEAEFIRYKSIRLEKELFHLKKQQGIIN